MERTVQRRNLYGLLQILKRGRFLSLLFEQESVNAIIPRSHRERFAGPIEIVLCRGKVIFLNRKTRKIGQSQRALRSVPESAQPLRLGSAGVPLIQVDDSQTRANHCRAWFILKNFFIERSIVAPVAISLPNVYDAKDRSEARETDKCSPGKKPPVLRCAISADWRCESTPELRATDGHAPAKSYRRQEKVALGERSQTKPAIIECRRQKQK